MNTLARLFTLPRFLTKAYLAFSALLVSTTFGQLAPSGGIHVQSPSGVYYLFGAAGTQTGGGFFYANYLTGQYDVISPVTVSSNGTFSGSSALTGYSVTGQIFATTISLTYNGVTVSSSKLSPYGPTSRFAGAYIGVLTNPALGAIDEASLSNFSDGFSFVVAVGDTGISFSVGSIDTSGHISVKSLSGETVTTTFAPSNGAARGTAQGSFGNQYSYGVTKSIPPRLANISTRGYIGTGEQVLIGGFIVKDGGKTVLLNAKGPSLASQGVANPIQNPKLDLYFGQNIIASNLNWRTNANAAEIIASGAGPTDDREASLQVTLEPGAYTVVVSSEDGSQGIGLVEAFGVE